VVVRLSTLSDDKAELDRRCEDLVVQRTDVQTRLSLLQTTLTQLRAADRSPVNHQAVGI